jgi:hypothetical protein
MPKCKYCGDPIYWNEAQFKRAGKWRPVNPDGSDHIGSCASIAESMGRGPDKPDPSTWLERAVCEGFKPHRLISGRMCWLKRHSGVIESPEPAEPNT